MKRTCILLDGGFVKKMLRNRIRRAPTSNDVVQLVETIKTNWVDGDLLRVYWYDADPYEKKQRKPISDEDIEFGKTQQAIDGRKLVQELELHNDFAVRRGRLMMHGWKLSFAALKKHTKKPTTLAAADLIPHFEQKGVDMRVGLDIARIAFNKTASTIVLVTADSDFIPAMKLARIEGIRVYLFMMGHGGTRELKVHADQLLTETKT